MKINIKDLTASMEINTREIELDVYDAGGNHLGDLVVTKSNVIWCPGKTNRENGYTFNWVDFIDLMENR